MTEKEALKLQELLDSEDYRIEIETRHDCQDVIEIVWDDIEEVFYFHGRYLCEPHTKVDVNQIIVTKSELIEDWINEKL